MWTALVGLVVVALVVIAGCHGGLVFPVPDYQQMLDEAIATSVPGGVLLVRTPRVHFVGSSGYSDLEARTPMRTDQLSRIASCTKIHIGVPVPDGKRRQTQVEGPAIAAAGPLRELR